MVAENDNPDPEPKMTPADEENEKEQLRKLKEALGAENPIESLLDQVVGDIDLYKDLMRKGFAEELTVDELACSLFEGTPHLQNLAETLARQHGKAGALSFYGLMGPEVQKFWRGIAQQLIDHAAEWGANEGSACTLSDKERNRLRATIDPTTKVKAKEVTTVTVTDPDDNLPVEVMIYKEEGGGMGGVDASYVEQEIGSVVSPHGNGELDFGKGDEPTT